MLTSFILHRDGDPSGNMCEAYRGFCFIDVLRLRARRPRLCGFRGEQTFEDAPGRRRRERA